MTEVVMNKKAPSNLEVPGTEAEQQLERIVQRQGVKPLTIEVLRQWATYGLRTKALTSFWRSERNNGAWLRGEICFDTEFSALKPA
jgi:hypothetical protein